VSADGGTILHCPGGSTTTYYTTDNGTNWSACSGVTLGSATPVADQVNANYFYIYHPSTGQMYRSTNKGVSFSVAATPGNSTANYPWESVLVRTVPGFEGHLWIPRGRNGLKYSTNYGVSYTSIGRITYCKSIGIGKAKEGASYPTIFIWGTVANVTGLFYSTDKGATWTKMNDDAHQFGGAHLLIGDMNTFGRVYMGAGGGRGIVYWEPVSATNLIEIQRSSNNLFIYPNPTKDGKFSIELPVTSNTANVNIFDNQGRLLFEKVFSNNGKLDIESRLQKGIYIVKVASEGLNSTQKLIVQ
ncbi:MAG TPA: T9SS type A sorting domain-containing protein, partial [Paludibacter sp.]